MIESESAVPRVLFLNANQPCYLAEPLLHGLRRLLGAACVDVPRYDSLYRPLTLALRDRLRGHGFTLYGLLDDDSDLAAERYLWKSHLDSWDLIIIANIWDQGDFFLDLCRSVPPEKIVVLDGYDTPALFPFALRCLFKPWLLSAVLRKNAYFQRELTNGGEAIGFKRFLPTKVLQSIPLPPRTFPIGFSIPAEKIAQESLQRKTKNFPRHIVDKEVADRLPGSFHSQVNSDEYAFSSEKEYYADLEASRFGITTKRAGWDCLRHYEMAANGCILCFRDLEMKPQLCAPHGLNPNNSISYSSADDLFRRLESLNEEEIKLLAHNSIEWVKQNTTVRRAVGFLSVCGLDL